MKLTLVKMKWIYIFIVLCFLVRNSLQQTTEATVLGDNSTTAEIPSSSVKTTGVQIPESTAASTKKPTTASGVQIKPVTKPTTAAPPKQYTASGCDGIQVSCDNKLTVYIDEVWNGRKLNTSCATNIPECCEWANDESVECLSPNTIIEGILRADCLDDPGQPCVVYEHSSHDIPCNNGLLNSHFTLIKFHCIDVPIPTTIESTTESTISPPVTTPNATTPSDRPTTTVSQQQGTTPKPLPIAIIAGAAGGGVALILLIILIVCCARRSHQRKMKQDMTKPALGVNPVSEIGVNYVDEENGSSDPDIIKTAPRTANGNDYTNYPLAQIH